MNIHGIVPLLTVLMAAPAGALAQAAPVETAPFVLGETLEVRSAALGESRLVDVALPAGYGDGERRYPVIVVLDGEALLRPAAGIVSYLSAIREMPEAIVVGVRNTSRMRDLTPGARPGWRPPIPSGEETGGADDFLRFLEDDLMRTLDERYRTHPYRVLVGHSLGGLFAAHALARRSEAFSAYLALDPALWWNDRALAPEALSVVDDADGAIRLASAQARGGFTAEDWSRIVTPGAVAVSTRHQLEDESHGSMPIVGIRLGLRSLFHDFDPGVAPPGGAPVRHLVEHVKRLSADLGYPVDLRPADLAAAVRQSLDARMLDDARDGIRLLAGADRDHPALAALERRLSEVESGPDEDFLPLVIDEVRPTPEAARDYLGRWEGTLDHEPGGDFTWIVTIDAAGDTLRVTGEQIAPDGSAMSGPLYVVGLTDEGVLELGHPLRGVPGMEVYPARMTAIGVLRGRMEIRGFEIPEGATVPNVMFELRRVEPGRD